MRSLALPLALPSLVILAAACSGEAGGTDHEDPGGGGAFATGGGASVPTGGSGPADGTGGVVASGGTSGDMNTGGGGVPGGSGGAGDGGVTFECGLPALSAPVGDTSELLDVLTWAGKQGAISYTFDDGNSSQIDNYKTLNELGVPFTFYLVTNWSGAQDAIWQQALADGHEIGNHSHTHPNTGSGSDLDAATAYIEMKWGVRPLTMAAPYGDSSYPPLASSRFLFNRGVGGGSIAPGGAMNRHNLPTYIPPEGATKAQLDMGVSSAVSQGHWQTVTIHGFKGGSDSAYQPIPLDNFVAHVEGVRDGGLVWIGTLLDVGAYLIGQQLLAAAAPQVDGASSTWSWTLPDHYPAERCLRVRSSGRVFQDGMPIAKDPLGYYEIALGAGHVTVTTD